MLKVIQLLFVFSLIVHFAEAQEPFSRIAFGSCSEEETPEQMWPDILAQKPQLWIWLGDNIYADTHDMTFLRNQYQKQKLNADYQKLVSSCQVIGTWDDHDYGVNDAGKFFTKKKESKEELLRFLDEPAGSPIRQHEGVYSSHTYGSGARKIKVILLDTRYFRDTLYRSTDPRKRYEPNKTGDVLGETQWVWLEQELTKSDASLTIIGSSIQFVAEDHGYEKWANFPAARDRLIRLLSNVNPPNTFIISGDRHIAEVSKMKIPSLPYELYDFTSSGLTHTWSEPMAAEVNQHRVGDMIIKKTFGMLIIDWRGKQPAVRLQVRGYQNALYQEMTLDFHPSKN